MSEIAQLMNRWVGWHSADWKPTPTPEDVLQEAIEDAGGPPWPEELLDLYRWSNGSDHQRVLPFGTLASLELLVSSDAGIRQEVFLGWWVDGREADVPHPYPLLISPEYVCIYVDRAGNNPGQVWGLDVGDLFYFADSLSEYMEGWIRMVERGEVFQDEHGWLCHASGDTSISPRTGKVELDRRPGPAV